MNHLLCRALFEIVYDGIKALVKAALTACLAVRPAVTSPAVKLASKVTGATTAALVLKALATFLCKPTLPLVFPLFDSMASSFCKLDKLPLVIHSAISA